MQDSKSKVNQKIIVNETPIENPNFDYKNLDTLENHWLKLKGKLVNGQKIGICLIYLAKGERIYCKFKNDKANGKGIYFKKNGQKVIGYWKNNRF